MLLQFCNNLKLIKKFQNDYIINLDKKIYKEFIDKFIITFKDKHILFLFNIIVYYFTKESIR